MRRWLVLVLPLLAFGFGRQDPQERGCSLDIRTAPGSESHYRRLPGGERRLDTSGPVEATCGSSWVRADSATYFEDRRELYLYRNVRYRDEQQTLVSDSARYLGAAEMIVAEGNVRLTNREDGSTLEGRVLHYFPRTEGRPVERIYAPERPHLTSYPDPETDTGAVPLEVDADRIHLHGDSIVAGAGNVVAERGELDAFGDSMHVDMAADRLWLFGRPRVQTTTSLLAGDTIEAVLDRRAIREVIAWPNASARGDEMSLAAARLWVALDGSTITRVVASRRVRDEPPTTDSPDAVSDTVVAARPDTATGVDDDRRAYSRSEHYTLVADSIDIQRPEGRLRRVISVGQARAEAVEAAVPDDSLFGRDWISGDTIVGHFEPADTSGADSVQVELVRLVASGGDARALYHLRPEENGAEDQRRGVNYVIGRAVTLWLESGEVQEAWVVGPARGLYLEPIRGPVGPDTIPGPVGPDTVAADAVTPRVDPSTTGAAPDTAPAPGDRNARSKNGGGA